jgi:adenylate cyclase
MSDFGKLVPQGGGEVIPLRRERLTIGRRESCDICLRFPNVSGTHCELTFQKGCWMIQDSGSRNGIKVNGEKVEKQVLTPGDVISVAKHNFVIQYNMTASPETLDELSEGSAGIMKKSLLEKAGLAKPPQPRPGMPGTPGKLNLPPLAFDDDFDDDDDD